MKAKLIQLSLLIIIYSTSVKAQSSNYYYYMYATSVPRYNFTDTPITVGVGFNYSGPDTIHSLNWYYSLNNSTPVKFISLDTIVPRNSPYTINFPTPLVIDSPGQYLFKLWGDTINGLYQSGAYDTIQYYTTFFRSDPALHKRVLLEEFTGAWCQYCAAGAVNFEDILLSDTDFIGISIHYQVSTGYGDSMICPEGVDLENLYTQSYYPIGVPSVTGDRFQSTDGFMIPLGHPSTTPLNTAPYSLETTFEKRKSMPSPANVSLKNMVYDSLAATINVDLIADFFADIDTSDFSTNLFITEDSIIQSDSLLANAYGWGQYNIYSYQSTPLIDTIPELFSLPEFIPDNGYRVAGLTIMY